MSAQRSIIGLDEVERDHAREQAHEHFPTPRLLVRAVLEAMLIVPLDEDGEGFATHVKGCPRGIWYGPTFGPLRIVDVGCGSGVWASEARRLFAALGIPVVITGIDNRPEVEPLARRWCDEVIIGDLRDVLGGEALDGAPVARRWDLLLSNPAFSVLRDLIPLAVEVATASIILHTEQALTRSRAAVDLVLGSEDGKRAPLPPRFELKLAGQVSFTGKGEQRIRIVNKRTGKEASGTDSLCYSVTTWQAGSAGPWPTTVMRLPPEARSWRVRPGEEPAADDLPEAPGWRSC